MAQWDRLWVNARVATMAAPHHYGLIADGAVAIAGERIAWVGERTALPASPARCANFVEDAEGKLLTPGLIDPHTHLIYAGNRAREFEMRLEGATYEEIALAGGGILSTVNATRSASHEELLDAASSRVEQMCAGGVTTVEIKSGYGLDRDTELRMLRVARELGRRHPLDVRTTFLGAHALPPEFSGRADAYVDLVCDVLREAASEGLVDAVDAFCERIAFSSAQVERVFSVARTLALPVKIHAEQLSDAGGALLAGRFQALSADHLEHLSSEGINALARAGTVAVLLPSASYFLREEHRPPVEGLRAAGVPIALATDCNPGTSPLTSLPVAMNMGCVRFGLTCEEALRGVTIHAARALGIAEATGTLEAGKYADMALWDAQHPAEIAYGLGQTRCRKVIRRGRA